MGRINRLIAVDLDTSLEASLVDANEFILDFKNATTVDHAFLAIRSILRTTVIISIINSTDRANEDS